MVLAHLGLDIDIHAIAQVDELDRREFEAVDPGIHGAGPPTGKAVMRQAARQGVVNDLGLS
jgi:hypothetical protein